MNKITSGIKSLRTFVQKHVRGNVLGDGIVEFCKALGINNLFTFILYAQDRKQPTKRMTDCKNFFSHHQAETDRILALLADDTSRQVYSDAIRYRQTHNPKTAPAYSEKDQYFVKGIVTLSPEEVFIDCGAFNGDTMKAFRKASGGVYKKIVCFEPVEDSCKKLEKRGAGKRVVAIQAGVYKETTTLYFAADNGKGSAIAKKDSAQNVATPVRAIDDTPECADATFIKMDVEGAEMDALRGAKETILKNKPKLAICIYHKDRDFIEIPDYILSLVPDYKLYVRHHSFSINETVLYAIPTK